MTVITDSFAFMAQRTVYRPLCQYKQLCYTFSLYCISSPFQCVLCHKKPKILLPRAHYSSYRMNASKVFPLTVQYSKVG